MSILQEQIPFPEDFDMKTGTLKISIDQGYIEVFIRNNPKEGSSNFAGSYHPNSVCEGQGICIHCGCTLFDSFGG